MTYIVLATYPHCKPTICVFESIKDAELVYTGMLSTTYLYECDTGKTSIPTLLKQKKDPYKGEM